MPIMNHAYFVKFRSVVVEFFCHRSIARPQKTPDRCKDLGDISCTNLVIVYFVSNFVAMATGVGRGGICVTLFNIHTPKTPCYVQESR